MSVKETQKRRGPKQNLLSAHLVGPPTFTLAGGEEVEIAGRKDRAILAYLCANSGSKISRDRLVELIWPNSTHEAGRASLRQALSTIRASLGANAALLLRADRDTVYIAREYVQMDVDSLGDMSADPVNVPAEWAGSDQEFLEGISSVAPGFESWRATENARISSSIVEILLRMAALAEEEHRFADAAIFLRQALGRDPFSEIVVRRLMRCHEAHGRPDQALRLFAEFEHRLEVDLQAQPERETREAIRAIRARRELDESSSERNEEKQKTSGEQTRFSAPNRTNGDGPWIAVMPFANLSDSLDHGYFCDGIAEDIITELSRFSSLFVIARNSSFSLRDEVFDARQITDVLGVQYLLEGSVRRSGKRLRITAKLIEGNSGGHIWSERYDRDLEDIFLVQDEITQQVVSAIAPQIELAEVSLRRTEMADPSAYDLALRAQARFYEIAGKSERQHLTEVVAIADQALALDPRSKHALWIKCFTLTNHFLGAANEDEAKETLELAWRSISDLLQVDENDARALAARGQVRHFRYDFEQARADLQRALALNPNHTWIVLQMAWHLSLTGEMEAARSQAHLALRLSPRDTDYWVGDAYLSLLQAHFADRDFEQAEAFGCEAIRFGPHAPIRRTLVASSLAHMGRPDDALRCLSVLQERNPTFISRVLEGQVALYQLPEHQNLLIDGLRLVSGKG